MAERSGLEFAGLLQPAGHAFISYVREDAHQVDQLQRALEAAGVSVWRDTASLWPGEDWRMKIRSAIAGNALVFIACFSSRSIARATSYQNEELTLAIDQLRRRQPGVPWLIPVRFDECIVPDLEVGGGRTLASIQRADLFGENQDAEVARLLVTVRRLIGQSPVGREERSARPAPSGQRSLGSGPVAPSDDVPAYLGRILHRGIPVGTCFQVAPGIMVSAWHVLKDCGAGRVGDSVQVDSLSVAASPGVTATVERIDEDHDLAALIRDMPLPGSVERYEPSSGQRVGTPVVVTGHAQVPAPGGGGLASATKRQLSLLATWAGGTEDVQGLKLAQLAIPFTVPGMGGAPARREADGAVVGMVCARHGSGNTEEAPSAWLIRTEDIREFLDGLADIALPTPELIRILELVKAREDLYSYVKRHETRDGMSGESRTRQIPAIYSDLARIYHDVPVLTGPDGPFPVAVFDILPAVMRDPEKILDRLVPFRPTSVHEPRIVDTIRERGSEIWNGRTFSLAKLTLDPHGRAFSLTAYLGSYFDMVCSAGYLEYELLAALKQTDARPSALDSLPARQAALSPYPTPRACLLAGGGVDAAIAISTLVVYPRDGEYWIMCEVRSKRVAEYGDLYHVVPSFIFQPVVAATSVNLNVEWSVRHNIFREYLEELFSVPEVEHAGRAVDPKYFYSHPNLTYIQRLLAQDLATITGVAVIFNLLNHRPEICTLLLITSDAWYEDQRMLPNPGVAGQLRHLNLNDEFMDHEHQSGRPHLESVTTLPLADERWAEIVRPWLMVPPGAPALVLGAREACRILGLAEPAWLRPFSASGGRQQHPGGPAN